MRFKVDNSPIKIDDGEWLGLCKNFEECENFVIREKPAKVYTCYQCKQHRQKDSHWYKYCRASYKLDTTPFTIRTHTLKSLVREIKWSADMAKKGTFSHKDAMDNIEHFINTEIITRV